MPQLSAPQIDRASAVLTGQACGDALGVPYEFGTAPLPGQLAEMLGGGLGPYAPGEWSDDTQMAICIAQVAATGADLNGDEALDGIAQCFLHWRADGATDIGNQTRWVLDAARTGSGPASSRLRDAARHYAAGHARSAGNGALMRTAIVGISAVHDRDATASGAQAIAELTHADPLAGDSCVLWNEAIRIAVLHRCLDVRQGLDLLPPARREMWRDWIGQAEASPPNTFAPNGFTVTALQAAWAAIVHTDPIRERSERVDDSTHFRNALQAAVRIGDDTDTVAAIAGGLLGAFWGKRAVPPEWVQQIHGWPGQHGGDLVRLARLTVTCGAVRQPQAE